MAGGELLLELMKLTPLQLELPVRVPYAAHENSYDSRVEGIEAYPDHICVETR